MNNRLPLYPSRSLDRARTFFLTDEPRCFPRDPFLSQIEGERRVVLSVHEDCRSGRGCVEVRVSFGFTAEPRSGVNFNRVRIYVEPVSAMNNKAELYEVRVGEDTSIYELMATSSFTALDGECDFTPW